MIIINIKLMVNVYILIQHNETSSIHGYIYIYTYNNLNEKVDLGAGAE
jgi:hypothetical protein